ITDKNSPREIYDTSRKLGEFFIGKFTGETVETVYMVTLDGRYRMISCECLCRGSVNSSHITPRMLIEKVLRDSASMVVIAHNHPGGLPIPSSDDIATTRVMYEALAVVDVCLLEHFVVAGDKYTLIMSGHMGKLGQKTPDESKYSNFYHEA
ncbi:MAG TPA: JAB domain-containing protein, partial [Bacillota bacterium]|nr:JAB domain-containing protein [Bacillota bacterium]